jgi:hypothetical protein
MYDGQWIRERIEENYGEESIYNIRFTHDILPVVTIEFGQYQKAVFQLDGYDQNKKVGYKFITAADENAGTSSVRKEIGKRPILIIMKRFEKKHLTEGTEKSPIVE